MDASIVKNVKKIGVLRSGALGDVIVTLPAIQAIRDAYPNAEIILLGKPWAKDFLPLRTPVDRFVEVPIINGIREEKNKSEEPDKISFFVQQMRNEELDIIIQFQGKGIAANPFVKNLGAKHTVGLVSTESEQLDRSISHYYFQSEIIRYLEVAALIGAKSFSLEPQVKVSEEDLEEANSFLKQIDNKAFVVLHPFAVDIRRSWPLEKFITLGEILFKEGYQVVFSGSEQDRPLIEDGISNSIYPLISSCGKLSLGGLGGLLSLSELVVSSDTGPLHLARAVGAKTVGIYWAPNLINWGPLSRNRHRPVVCWKMECPICGTIPVNPYPYLPVSETCDHNLSFVKEVKVEEVLEEVELLTNKKIKQLG